MGAFTQLDGGLLIAIQNACVSDFLTPLMIFITHLGDSGAICIAAAVLLLCTARYRKAGVLMSSAMLAEFAVNNLLLKNLFHRVRPYETFEAVKLLVAPQWDWSFPSGHSAAVFCAAVTAFLTLPRRYGVPALVLAAVISFSRLYVGVHYPSDVLCGALSGGLIAYLVYVFFSRRLKWSI